MTDQTKVERPDVPVAFNLSRHWAVVGLLYVAGYVLLDWISLVEPYAPFGISAWNLGNGLSFSLVLLFGRRVISFLLVAELMWDLVHWPLPFRGFPELVEALLNSGGYGATLLALPHPRLPFDPALSSIRDLLLLMLA